MVGMIYRKLGNTGLLVSEVSFGSWVTFSTQVDIEAAYELMKVAYKAGVNFFDNAETYAAGKSELVMGEAIKLGLKNGDWERENLVVSTKIFFGTKKSPNTQGLSRKHIIEGTMAACKRMQLDYVDLVFCHRPDPLTPVEETVRAMHNVIERGFAFYWGTSEWSSIQIEEAVRHADRLGLHRPVMEQPQYNLFCRNKVEKDFLNLYANYKYGLTTWSPLGLGLLTGKYSGNIIPEGSRLSLPEYSWLRDRCLSKVEDADKLAPIAAEVGCTMGQLAIAWCLTNKNVSTVILGASNKTQLEENLAARDFVSKLTPEILEKIEACVGTKPERDEIEIQVTSVRQY